MPILLSVIIPVYQQWSLTAACLRSLAATLPAGLHAEVLVVDNASTDATPEECPALGQALFGETFYYHRFARNQNFGPACNFGASQAKGQYLLFLNNDIVLSANWFPPLLEDFYRFEKLGATSPLLLYPEQTPLGFLVQHLGITLSPLYKLSHLYEGIPAASPLASRRRFFQMITAACLLMRRDVFLSAGAFDEVYRNGFEDVDLCARLGAQGLRFTVNPESRVFHHTSQSPGRKAHEKHNAEHLTRKALPLLNPDLPALLEADGLEYRLSPWLHWEPSLPIREEEKLKRRFGAAACWDYDFAELQNTLREKPLWADGYLALLNTSRVLAEHQGCPFPQSQDLALWQSTYKLFPDPGHRLALVRFLARCGGTNVVAACLPDLLASRVHLETLRQKNRAMTAQMKKSAPKLIPAHQEWARNSAILWQDVIQPLNKEIDELAATVLSSD